MSYTVNSNVTKKLFDELYDNSALTLEGLNLASLDDYANYLNRVCGLKDGAVFHIIQGYEMNDLSGNDTYPEDLHIVVIKLNDLINPNNIIMKRFDFGGRWFDDVVDNNVLRAFN